MKKTLRSILHLGSLTLFLSVGVFAQIATGGNYSLDQAVVGNGGGGSAGGNYTAQGTTGQSAAGTNMSGGNYSALNGFWSNSLAPTAASAKIEGRVIGSEGIGLRNISVILTGGTLTSPRIVKTNSFGNFAFEDVEVGQFYVVSVSNKKYGFGQESQTISLTENVSNIIFQSTWEN